MAYNSFDPAKPVITDTRQQVVDNTRYNLMALRDAAVMGVMPGYAYSWSGGAADQPDIQYWKKGNTWFRFEITWGSAGGEEGNPVQIVYKVSYDGGSNYETIKTETLTWDSDGNLTATSWS